MPVIPHENDPIRSNKAMRPTQPGHGSRQHALHSDVKIGDMVYDADYGLTGLIVGGPWTFTDDDGQTHEWEFLIMFDDGGLAGSDSYSLTLARDYNFELVAGAA